MTKDQGPRWLGTSAFRVQNGGWRGILSATITLSVLALAGALVAAGEPLWGLAAVLFGLAAVFIAAARWGSRTDRRRANTEVVDGADRDDLPPAI